jgi:hypothetical protein
MAFGDFISSATNAVNAVSKTLSSFGPASALSSVTNAVSGITSAIGSLSNSTAPAAKLPLKNELFNYASYDYVLGIGVLSANDVNFPDSTYMANKSIPLLCKSANSDSTNRIQTAYGKFDFFIDDLVIESNIGGEKGKNTNATGIRFQITEPYSMGMFMLATQSAGYLVDWPNWRETPFLLTIDFRGNKETGQMDNISGTSRKIPFFFTQIGIRVTGAGSVYTCEAMPYNQTALTDRYSKLKSDVSAKGTTVIELLQTGDKSLQVVVNDRFKQLVKDKVIAVADEILILFPQDIASGSGAASADAEKSTGATTTPAAITSPDIFKKLGVARGTGTINKTLLQPSGASNSLGSASMAFSPGRKGDHPTGNDNEIYDPVLKVNVRANNTINTSISDFKFRQDTDIVNAINQVLLASDFPRTTFEPSNLSPEGYRGWWRIDVQTYALGSNANMGTTGEKPKLIVYRVVEYGVHASELMPPNTPAPGFDELKKQAVKVYDYLYTGKNVDIIKFEIEFNNSFSATLSADNYKRSQDVKTSDQTGTTAEPTSVVNPITGGSDPDRISMPTTAKYDGIGTKTEKLGGGGPETTITRAARLFHDAINSGVDMMGLNMEIIGDPYYIAQSGQGNYTSGNTANSNLNADGTVDYQRGQVDIVVNFRTPTDVNQTTGLYDFGSGNASAPVVQFSGLYVVTNVTSEFKGGIFKQTLHGYRRPQQESKKETSPDKTFNNTSTIDASDPTAYGDG